ncbi:unnamed protein product [Adineta steineri]|uniref:Uncharacterized protein n=1 Tax=Adineta steineri TaxID=433720 RepID=A0A813WVW4_9BILA|nr:unnamed protein product [Adineta steineri]CAF0948438.1 unnamed protein product [Adineta steineri]
MIVNLVLIFLTINNIILNDAVNNSTDNIPFFVMKPRIIINQTLHSYCKEQYEFNTRPMYIDLNIWPSGFIYTYNPYEKFDFIYDTTYEECTVELRAPINDQIRLIFYSADKNNSIDYDEEYDTSQSKSPCLRIRDVIYIYLYQFKIFIFLFI